jgi:hypothetical protein
MCVSTFYNVGSDVKKGSRRAAASPPGSFLGWSSTKPSSLCFCIAPGAPYGGTNSPSTKQPQRRRVFRSGHLFGQNRLIRSPRGTRTGGEGFRHSKIPPCFWFAPLPWVPGGGGRGGVSKTENRHPAAKGRGVGGVNQSGGGRRGFEFWREKMCVLRISDALLPQPTSSSSFLGFWFWKIHFLGKRVIQSHLAFRMRYLVRFIKMKNEPNEDFADHTDHRWIVDCRL